MDETTFDRLGEAELRHIEDAFADVDPDEVEVVSRGGVLELTLRDGSKLILNTHRAAREIWLAAQAGERRAWHFAYDAAAAEWRVGTDELRATITRLLTDRLGLTVRFV